MFILSALNEPLQILCGRDLGWRPCPGVSRAEASVEPGFLSTGSRTPFLSASPRTSFLPMFSLPPAQSINGFYWTALRGRLQALTTLVLSSKAKSIPLASSHVSSFQATSFFHQAPLSVRFPRQEFWGGLPFPSPGDLPNPGIETVSSTLAGGFFTTESPGKPLIFIQLINLNQ